MNNLNKIVIENLHGNLNYEIIIKDNVLILVAENGTGKTTIVNIIYYFLSRQWEKLATYNFSSVTAYFNEASPIKIVRDELSNYTRIRRLRSGSLRRRFSSKQSDLYETILHNYNIETLMQDPGKIELLSETYGININTVYDIIHELYKSGGNDCSKINYEKKKA